MSIKYRLVERKLKIAGEGEKVYRYALKARARRAPIEEVAELISERSAMSRGDVLSVLENLGWACKIIMRSGASVSLPHFGSISSTIRGKAAKEGEPWAPENIRGVSLRFSPSGDLRSAMQRVGFERIKETADDAGSGTNTPTPPSIGGGDSGEGDGGDVVI